MTGCRIHFPNAKAGGFLGHTQALRVFDTAKGTQLNACDEAEGLYYTTAGDEATFWCPLHWYEAHFAPGAGQRLVAMDTEHYEKECAEYIRRIEEGQIDSSASAAMSATCTKCGNPHGRKKPWNGESEDLCEACENARLDEINRISEHHERHPEECCCHTYLGRATWPTAPGDYVLIGYFALKRPVTMEV